MPELPEVETIRRQLQRRVAGRVIVQASVLDALLVQPESPRRFAAGVRGRRIEEVGRRGKYLLLELDSGDTLAMHLRMTGQILWSEGRPDRALRHVRARFGFDDGSRLVFSDVRRFGRAWIVPADLPDREAYWADRVGAEPLGRGFTAARLGGLLIGRRGPIKPLLLNQTLVAGIGNIYADEALFQARVHPLRPGGSLDTGEVAALRDAIRDRLQVAVRAGGSSIDRYRDTAGETGAMQTLLRVHLQAGRPCPNCGTTIVKTRVGGRGTYHCPSCQEGQC
jgi:formamidopyrimidine-DNA glycosylase